MNDSPEPGDPTSDRGHIEKGAPVNDSERYLQRLAERTFLRLWSYPSVYRDQGRASGRDGKEIADLLVVFENDVLIFSDKVAALPLVGDLEKQWPRWYRRAVLAAADQIAGGERWLREFPDRVFLDRQCTRKFPYELPVPDQARFHRIVVAHGASERCRYELGGSGSLMLLPRATGAASIPFSIGDIDPNAPYVHVLDDTTVDIVFSHCDTITDFVRYLSKKEQLVRSGRFLTAAGEEEVLAHYLTHTNSAGEHDVEIPPDVNGLVLQEGIFAEYLSNDQFSRKKEADQVSYLWDDLIEEFTGHLIGGTLHHSSSSEFSVHEEGLRLLAREPRIRRRMLASSFLEMLKNPDGNAFRRARMMEPSNASDPYYVFLALARDPKRSYEDYREMRRALSLEYCRVVRLIRSNARKIVCIAVDMPGSAGGSEDLVVYDGSVFSTEERDAAEAARQQLGLLKNGKRWASLAKEYPDSSSPEHKRAMPQRGGRFPGTGRNDPCPCGQTKKYKKCCGP